MQERWQAIQRHLPVTDSNTDDERTMLFERVDFTCERLELWDNASFDLVLDKSTLDCLLCTDKATAGLLTEIYRLLKPGGVYLLISFHEQELLHPLLSNLPGADWHVSSCVMQRKVEDLIRKCTSHKADETKPAIVAYPKTEFEDKKETSVECCRTVNVFQCRKRQPEPSQNQRNDELNWNAVYHHVHDTNDQWFQKQNPMLSDERRLQIEAAFKEKSLALVDAFMVLFTETEREHLDYHGFLEDWEAFCQSHDEVDSKRISAQVAISFLAEMQ